MRKYIGLLAVAAAISLVAGVLGAVIVQEVNNPAAAANTTVLDHTSDSGYDAPITVKCADGRAVNVPEGSSSADPGGCVDIKQVYIHSAPIEEIRCFRGTGWYTLANTPGWHNVTDWAGHRNCVNQIRNDNV